MLYVNYIPKKNKLIHIYFQVALGVKNSPDKAGDLRDVGSGLLGWSRVYDFTLMQRHRLDNGQAPKIPYVSSKNPRNIKKKTEVIP